MNKTFDLTPEALTTINEMMLVHDHEITITSCAFSIPNYGKPSVVEGSDWMVLFGHEGKRYYSYDCGWGETVSEAVMQAAEIARGR